MGSSFVSLFTPLTDRLWGALFSNRDTDRGICQSVWERIYGESGEIRNFQHIVDKRPYKNPGHKRAVTQISFKKLAETMKDLSGVRAFHDDAIELRQLAEQELARLAEESEAAEILAVLQRLEPRLRQRADTKL